MTEQRHCDHECVCNGYILMSKMGWPLQNLREPCIHKERYPETVCQHDTRSRPAPCSFSCMKRTILESAQVSHSATSKPEEMYLVTKKELNLIKNDCAYPERQFCDGCECADGEDNTRASGLGCNFEGANAVMDRVLSRPAPAAKQPINGCWYYDHNVCGLPHPSPTADKHDAAVRAEAKREERERVLKIAQHLADTIPDFNRMDYMHFLKESLRRGEP